MYDRILVPLDGSKVAECVIPYIEGVTKASKGAVELITVVEPLDIPTRGKIALGENDLKRANMELRQEAQKYLGKLVRRLTRSGVKARPVILTGKPAESLIEYANNNDVDLIIMATHGRSGISKMFWGSIAEKVMRSANTPVLLVKAASCNADS